MKIILFGTEEYAYAPQRLRHIIAVIDDVPSWRKAIFALTIGGSVELRAEDAVDAEVKEGDFVDPLFELSRSSLERDPFIFVVEMTGDETDLCAKTAYYNSYKRIITFQLWERGHPDLRIEFRNLSYFTTDLPD